MAWTLKDYDNETAWEEQKRIRARFPGIATVSFECLSGWFPLLEKMFGEIRTAIPEGKESEWALWQVKEKLSGLRVYWRYASDDTSAEVEAIRHRIQEAVRLAEARADHTCEVCGARGRFRNKRGSLMLRCDEHADGGIEAPDEEAIVYGIGKDRFHFDPDRDVFIQVPEDPDDAWDPDFSSIVKTHISARYQERGRIVREDDIEIVAVTDEGISFRLRSTGETGVHVIDGGDDV